MASPKTLEIVKATVPVLEEHGTAITTVFYKNMFNQHPELLDIFNETNQKLGRQQTALAMTVLAAAKHLDKLAVLLPQVTQISHKHRALQILPEHYPIVGHHLIGAIKEVLGEAANDDIIDAWTEAYDEIADVFIQLEKTMYEQEMWEGFAPFKITEKVEAATDIAAFTVVPANDDIDLSKLSLSAGQYITVKADPEDSDHLALRHYSLYSATSDKGIQFAVRRDNRNEHYGLVSNHLHDHLDVGDTILLSAPAGDFELNQDLIQQNDIPLVLVSAGVGVTPILSMLEAQVTANPKRPIVWVYACQNKEHHAFDSKVNELLAAADNVEKHIFYFESGQILDEAWLANLPKPADIYVCGSMMFMESIIDGLMALDHGVDSVHYEPFGPKMSLELA
ncbi:MULTISPECIES: globin domain-containing protein [Psychrobacter]|jgi:nitric oxide dioxygenase|uniref:nitric oxide dioxygenase n=2 Tax=Psychrobacter TaxID=497 RepID=A0ABR8RH71_9GAMM|nr:MULTISPECIES: globin domain-containing protein [Psychrobacter]MBD7947110.1 flavohemoprotein [Psychrobacter communis]MDP4545811.1 FAD-binding oxidoreductase [Psychrobacter faecalis]